MSDKTERKPNVWNKIDPKTLPKDGQALALTMIEDAERLSKSSKALHEWAAKSKEVFKPAGKKVIYRSKKSGTVRRFETCYVAADSGAKPTMDYAAFQKWQQEVAAQEAAA